ncbi:MAG: DUF4157 domain-containing protein [Pyrinomonadaceae bacterium]
MCQAKQSDQSQGRLQAGQTGLSSMGQTIVPPVVLQVLRSPGQPLASTTRSFFEPRFGHDFSHVRVHADASADDSAVAMNARAYTIGRDIVFRRSEFTPQTESGRRLLAHELSHVIQQRGGLAPGIQRAPDPDDASQPTRTTPSAQPVVTPVPDPDASEAAARAAGATLPQIDLTHQTPQENDAAAQQLVITAFGGEDRLNAAFETLSSEVKKQVDADSIVDVTTAKRAGQTPDADRLKTANRAQFLARMRLYFGSWTEVMDHFRAIERLSDGSVDIFLHASAKARLQRVLTVLKSKGHKLPTIGEGFSLRHLYRARTDIKGNQIIEHPGMMVHAMGYAFDVSAKANPKISFGSPQSTGLERHDQNLLAVTIGGDAAHMDLGKNNLSFTEAMGKRTAGDTVAADDDTDPAAVEYFKRFETQFHQMEQGSLAFTRTLSVTHRNALLKIRAEYFDELKAIRDERKKGTKADAKVIAVHEAIRRTLLQSIPPLMSEWIAAIDAEISREFAKHPGMDKLRSPGEISRDLSSKKVEVQQATRDEAQAQAANIKATSERDIASAMRKQAEEQERRAPGGAQFQRAHEATRVARQRLAEKIDALVEVLSREIDTRRALSAATTARDALANEMKASDTPQLSKSWVWIERLRELRQALTAPDLSTPAGLRAFERLTTGDLSELGVDAPPDNPPLLRLLDIGFFNPTGAFDLLFFKEVAHSGFWVGASWNFGSVDSMHFELAEGRTSLLTPGKS